MKIQLNALFPPASKPVQQYLMSNPLISGAVIEASWSDFDDGTGKWNFSKLDAALAPWIKAGKKVSVVLWAVSNSSAGQFGNASTPSYMWPKLGVSNYANLVTQAGEQRIPNYLAPVWAEYYKPAIAALGAHLKGVADYVRVGLGHGGETIPGANWNDPQAGLPKAWGITVDSWLAYIDGMLASYPKNTVQWMVGITPMGSPSYEVPNAIAAAASKLGIGFGSQGLESSDLTAKVTTANWLGNFKLYPSVPHELQTIGQSCPSGSNCGNNANQNATGPLPPLLVFGKANGCDIFEVYTNDLFLAFDPQTPGYAQYGEAYASALEALVK
jgi:hypothetical protein